MRTANVMKIKFPEDTSREITPENMPLQIKLSTRTLCELTVDAIASCATQNAPKKYDMKVEKDD